MHQLFTVLALLFLAFSDGNLLFVLTDLLLQLSYFLEVFTVLLSLLLVFIGQISNVLVLFLNDLSILRDLSLLHAIGIGEYLVLFQEVPVPLLHGQEILFELLVLLLVNDALVLVL